MPKGSQAFLFAVLALGVGATLFGLGLAPATTEALPFAIVLLIVGAVVGLPSYRTLKQTLAPDPDEQPGALGPTGAARPPSSVACPNCGGPAPLQLAEPDHSTCAHCGNRFALPGELAGVLRAAAGHLHQQSEAERHIAGSIEKLAVREQGWIARLKNISRSLAVVAALVTIYGWFGRSGNDLWHCWFAFGVAAFLWVGWLSRITTRVVPAWIRRIVGRWTALQLPGMPGLSCRVCGGPLPARTAAVLRCGYCSADNLAGPEVLEQLAASARHAQRGSLAFDQRRRQGDELAAFALLLFPALGLLGWFALGAFAGSGFIRVGNISIWSDGGARFAVVRTLRYGKPEVCVAVTVPRGDQIRVVYDFDHLPMVGPEVLIAASIGEPVDPSWLIGKEIDGKGKVTSLHRIVRHPSRHLAEFDSGSTHYLPSDFGVLGGELTCLRGVDPGTGPSIDLNAK